MLISTHEVMNRTKLSGSTISRLRIQGKFPEVKERVGKLQLFNEQEVMQWIGLHGHEHKPRHRRRKLVSQPAASVPAHPRANGHALDPAVKAYIDKHMEEAAKKVMRKIDIWFQTP